MPNPYLILVVVFLWAGSLFVAFGKGETVARNEIVAAQKKAQDEAIQKYNENSTNDMIFAADVARRDALEESAAAMRRQALEKGKVDGRLVQVTGDLAAAGIALKNAQDDAQRLVATARLGCTVSDGTFRLLNDDIAAYNASASTSGGRVDAVPANPAPSRPKR